MFCSDKKGCLDAEYVERAKDAVRQGECDGVQMIQTKHRH